MRIDRKEVIAGFPILRVRDFLSMIGSDLIDLQRVKSYFKIKDRAARALINELVAKGFIVKEKSRGNGYYEVTIAGNAFSMAKCVAPLNKAKVDKIFSEFMERVQEVNKSDFYLFRISKVLLFGSYIDPAKSDYADIDIAIELEPKVQQGVDFVQMRMKQAQESGRRFPSFIHAAMYSEDIVVKALRNRSRYISIHKTDDPILKMTPVKQVFP